MESLRKKYKTRVAENAPVREFAKRHKLQMSYNLARVRVRVRVRVLIVPIRTRTVATSRVQLGVHGPLRTRHTHISFLHRSRHVAISQMHARHAANPVHDV
jgi:hypothetical protein